MSVMTVTGEVASGALGVILPHEHLLIDLRNQFTEPTDPRKLEISRQPLCMHNLGYVRSNPYAIRDNLLIDDVDTVTQEVNDYAEHGGRTIVDCTSIGIQRNPVGLRELAKRTGVNIIAGCGYYTYDTHPAQMDAWDEGEIADQMLRDMLVGMDGTDIRAGIYGEIGTSDPIRPNERKALLAVARAFAQHPAEVQVHTYPWGKAGIEAAQLLIDDNVAPDRIVICHIDVEFDLKYLSELLALGINIEFDNFGKEFYINKADRGFAGGVFARDIERVRVVRDLLDQGFESQILVTNDICLKSMLKAYGGHGYSHILENIVPMMQDEGISTDTIRRLLQDNPARVLTGGV